MRNSMLGLVLAPLILFSSCDMANTKERSQEFEDTRRIITSKQENKLILFFGNSLTAGYGLKPEQAFPALIQSRIDSMGLAFEVLNAGLLEETSADGRQRIDWLLNKDIDIFVMEIGINDRRAGIPSERTQENIQAIIDTVQRRNPHTTIILAGVENLPQLAHPENKQNNRQNIYPALASEYEVALVPCILNNVKGIPSRIQGNSLFPTAEGHKVVAQNVWQVLRPFLTRDRAASMNYD